jgi:lipoprotein signal peptidase
MKIPNGVKAISLIVLVLLVDQIIKLQIKTSMTIGESIPVLGNWFQIRFIENPGMAFGFDIPGRWGKPVLTIFRIIAVFAIVWYLNQLINKKVKTGLILCVALISLTVFFTAGYLMKAPISLLLNYFPKMEVMRHCSMAGWLICSISR